MAKKTQRRSRAVSRASEADMDMDMDTQRSERRSERSSEGSQKDYKAMLRELAANPAVRYVAGGIATAVLTKVANNLSQKYPEISRFISENLDGIEGRLGDFKNSLNNDQMNQSH